MYQHILIPTDGSELSKTALLKQNLTRHPNDSDTLLALINFSRDAGNLVDALQYAEELAATRPGDRDLKSLISELRHQVK